MFNFTSAFEGENTYQGWVPKVKSYFINSPLRGMFNKRLE